MNKIITTSLSLLLLSACSITPPKMDPRYCEAKRTKSEAAYQACMTELKRNNKKQPSFTQNLVENLIEIILD